MSILQAKEMSGVIKKFIETVDNHFIKPKKEEYYNLVRHFKYCKQGIKDINFRKKIRRKSIKDWLWTGYYIFVNNLKVPFMY
jgi:predicted AlkP superfamily phosphohydrolase/phosphomutase